MPLSPVDWRSVRQQFPSIQNRVYLNTATYGQLPKRCSEAVAQHFTRRDQHACSDFLSWFDDVDALRASIGRWINSSPEDIALVTTASHALSIVLNGIDWQEGDEILTLQHEFPNQVYAAQSRHGVRGVVCPWNELEQNLSSRTRLVLLSTVNYQTGIRPDLQTTIRKLRERSILVYLDGTQSVGALRMDCEALQPDFLAVDAYKWMISPNGAGFLYVRPEIREWLSPNVIGWRSDRGWRSVETLHSGAPRFADSAERYEGGMLPFPSLAGMQASLALFAEIGSETIEAKVLQLARSLREKLLALGAVDYPHVENTLASQILLMKIPDVDSSVLAKNLAERSVHISARREYLRISPHFYNDENDIDAFIDAVRSQA
jgi:cysteine desulfurase / selenocysteine lyase